MKIKFYLRLLFYRFLPKKTAIDFIYYRIFKKEPSKTIKYVPKIRWNNPLDLNEKINWQKLNYDMEEWVRCADKYLVREYVTKRGLENILVPLYGVYKSADEINFSKLPSSFVMKLNNGSGDCIIVKDKSIIDEEQIRQKLSNDLKRKYGLTQTEWHYLDIPPLIIAEKLLINESQISLIDYKIWCFNGVPHCIFVVSNRNKATLTMDLFDLNWNSINENLVGSSHMIIGKGEISKPQTFAEMINAAKVLSKGHPQVRVDFYEVEGKLYFGELTFTSNGGFMKYFNPDYLLEMGSKIKLPIKVK